MIIDDFIRSTPQQAAVNGNELLNMNIKEVMKSMIIPNSTIDNPTISTIIQILTNAVSSLKNISVSKDRNLIESSTGLMYCINGILDAIGDQYYQSTCSKLDFSKLDKSTCELLGFNKHPTEEAAEVDMKAVYYAIPAYMTDMINEGAHLYEYDGTSNTFKEVIFRRGKTACEITDSETYLSLYVRVELPKYNSRRNNIYDNVEFTGKEVK
nr:MAG TPA: hypothetical protein [Caudoviricetes sp.]